MKGITFIRQTKLHDVCGRVNYISSHEEQEHLYATYETRECPFWEDLAHESQVEFKKSGTTGKCIEARGLVIALPKSLQQFNPNELLQYFTEEFKKKYGVECSSALHHNPRKTNYHIHLIYSERTLLDVPVKKVAGRNMFFNAEGKRLELRKKLLMKMVLSFHTVKLFLKAKCMNSICSLARMLTSRAGPSLEMSSITTLR